MTRRPSTQLWLPALLILVAFAGPARLASADDVAEFVGRSDQDGSSISHYGYLTHVRGVPDADLFFDPVTRTEATARITYFATTTLNARHVVGNVITTATVPGTLTFFRRAVGGASFASPASFQAGTPLGVLAIRYHNVLNVQGVDAQGHQVGIASATADADGAGLRLRIFATGEGTLLVNDPARFVSVFVLGGNMVDQP